MTVFFRDNKASPMRKQESIFRSLITAVDIFGYIFRMAHARLSCVQSGPILRRVIVMSFIVRFF